MLLREMLRSIIKVVKTPLVLGDVSLWPFSNPVLTVQAFLYIPLYPAFSCTFWHIPTITALHRHLPKCVGHPLPDPPPVSGI